MLDPNLFDVPRSWLTKTSGSETHLGDAPEEWRMKALAALHDRHPWVSRLTVRTVISQSRENGFGIGYFVITSAQVPASAAGSDRITAVTIPILIRDHSLAPLDLFEHKGTYYPLSEERVMPILRLPDIYGEPLPHETVGYTNRMHREYPQGSNFGMGQMSSGPGVYGLLKGSEIKDRMTELTAAALAGAPPLRKKISALRRRVLSGSQGHVRRALETAKRGPLLVARALKGTHNPSASSPPATPVLNVLELAKTSSGWVSRAHWLESPEDGRPGPSSWEPTTFEKISDVLDDNLRAQLLTEGWVACPLTPRVKTERELQRAVAKRSAPAPVRVKLVDWFRKASADAESISGMVFRVTGLEHPHPGLSEGARVRVVYECDSDGGARSPWGLANLDSGELFPMTSYGMPCYLEPIPDQVPVMLNAARVFVRNLPRPGSPMTPGVMVAVWEDVHRNLVGVGIRPAGELQDGTPVFEKMEINEEGPRPPSPGAGQNEQLFFLTQLPAVEAITRGGDAVTQIALPMGTQLLPLFQAQALPDMQAGPMSDAEAAGAMPPESMPPTDMPTLYPPGTPPLENLKVSHVHREWVIDHPQLPELTKQSGPLDYRGALVSLLTLGVRPREAVAMLKASRRGPLVTRIPRVVLPSDRSAKRSHAEQVLPQFQAAAARLQPHATACRTLAMRVHEALEADKPSLGKFSADSLELTLDSALALGFINPRNLVKLVSSLRELEEAQSKLCSLLLASRIGVSELSEVDLEGAIVSMEPILTALRVLDMALELR